MSISKHILNTSAIPAPPDDPAEIPRWLKEVLVPTVVRLLEEHNHQHPQSIRGEARVKPYTDAGKPSATEAGEGAVILVTDGAAGTQFRGSVGGAYVNLG